MNTNKFFLNTPDNKVRGGWISNPNINADSLPGYCNDVTQDDRFMREDLNDEE